MKEKEETDIETKIPFPLDKNVMDAFFTRNPEFSCKKD